MSRASRWAAWGLSAFFAVSWLASTAQARPNYSAELHGMFPNNAAVKTTKCGVCHGAEKKVRNNYGMAVGAALGGVKVAGPAVKAAIENSNTKPNAVAGKTFGDLLKAGMLP